MLNEENLIPQGGQINSCCLVKSGVSLLLSPGRKKPLEVNAVCNAVGKDAKYSALSIFAVLTRAGSVAKLAFNRILGVTASSFSSFFSSSETFSCCFSVGSSVVMASASVVHSSSSPAKKKKDK